jgi:hypothetical protein
VSFLLTRFEWHELQQILGAMSIQDSVRPGFTFEADFPSEDKDVDTKINQIKIGDGDPLLNS